MIFIAGDNATIVLQPGEKPFNLPSAFVPSERPAILCCGLYPVSPMGRDQGNVRFLECFIEGIGIIGPVSHNDAWILSDKSSGNRSFHQRDLMW